MSDVFIAHVEEDAEVALEIALGLEEAGYTTWCYEVDSIPGPSYLIQTGQAIEQAKAVVVLISPHSVSSRQVTKEVVRAHESGKDFIPILRSITHIEFQKRQPEWREAVGAAASIRIPQEGVAEIVPRIISGLRLLGIDSSPKINTSRIRQISKALDELRGLPVSEKAEKRPMAIGRLEAELAAVKVPPAKIAEEAGKRRRWIKPALIGAGSVVIIAVIAAVVANPFEGDEELTKPEVTMPPAAQESTVTIPPVVQEPPVTPEQAPPTLPPLEPAASVTFPDKNLEAVVRSALGKQAGEEITAAELMNLTRMNADQKGIVDLTGIEYCINLYILTLKGNRISALSPLSSLTNLNRLYLPENQISDISALSPLTNLTELHLPANQISDISALSPLTNLTGLRLDGNQINDISALSPLTNLTELHLPANQISDISALSSLTNLTGLRLEANQISDIQPLVANSGLSEGDMLTLTGNPLSPTSVNVYVPQLEQRGVTVEFD